ncbi:MAG TPA: hypothetical protein VKP02_09340 [Gemmatimonadaceae bacterium]|nr:hypothetical protein [Gemmatimonadaceae bacterium]
MPKAEIGFDLERYAPVARRITLFYERYPTGRIITALVERDARAVIFRASVYRGAEDAHPAATGWALEREGDGDVNAVACLENTETSAIGRALANLGFTASAERPSREEMMRVSRARQAPLRVAAPRQRSIQPSPISPLLQSHADALSDTLSLLALARQAGMRPARAARTSARLLAHPPAREDLARMASRLRAWLRRQHGESTAVM